MSDKKISSLDILKKTADEDLLLEKDKLDYEAMRTPLLHNKWLRMLFERKEKLAVLEWKKKIQAKDKWLYYTGKADPSIYKEKGKFELKVLKGDLNMFIEADEEIHRLEASILRTKNEMEFIQRTLDEINRRSFHISNAIKALKFLNGEM